MAPVDLSAERCSSFPKGVEHKPYAEREVKLLLIEPRGVRNTGDQGGDTDRAERRVDLRNQRTALQAAPGAL
jgi:mannose-6-phosphate isomerase-like protein (cupin superfamily)